MRTLDTWISDHARDTPDAPALLFDAALWTYADFNTEIDACAECFLTHGIRHGDRIAPPRSMSIEHLGGTLTVRCPRLHNRLQQPTPC